MSFSTNAGRRQGPGMLTGDSRWVFPGVRTNGEPMSKSTVNAALRRLGYDPTMITAHGARLQGNGVDPLA